MALGVFAGPRAGIRAPGVLVAVVLGCSAAGVATSVRVGLDKGESWPDMVLGVLVVLGFCVVGAVIVSARPGHKVGWLLLVAGVCWAVGNGAIDHASYGIVDRPGAVPGVSAYALGGAVVRDIGWYALVLGLPIYFPTGSTAGPRWRWLPRLMIVCIVAAVVDTVVSPGANLDLDSWHNPWALPPAWRYVDYVAGPLSIPLALAVVITALFQLRQRWRHGDALQRQQLRLFMVAAGLPVVAGPLSLLAGTPVDLFSILALPLPLAIAFAVLARGLYDLRTAVDRTLVWVILSGLVAGVYALVIATLGGVLNLGTVAWLPAVAVGVVAVSFAPLRDLLQRAVDRLMYGHWGEPYEVLTRLGQRIERTSDVGRLLDEAVAELAELGLHDVAIEDAHSRVLACSGAATPTGPNAGAHQLELSAYGERVGMLRFGAVVPLRPSDRRLLEDLAVHLGSLLHDHRVTAELQSALERVVLAREEERRRLRRDLHDGLGPALAGHLLRLDLLAWELGPGSRPLELVDGLRKDLRSTVLDVRRVVEGLRPPALDDLGLAGALDQAVSRLTGGTSLLVDVHVGALPTLPAAVEVAVFRIVTEAVTNVVRHAGASRCGVEVTAAKGRVRIVVDDDGIGIEQVAAVGNGLHTMRERAEEMRGSFQLLSTGGTAVVAELPLVATSTAQPAVEPAAS